MFYTTRTDNRGHLRKDGGEIFTASFFFIPFSAGSISAPPPRRPPFPKPQLGKLDALNSPIYAAIGTPPQSAPFRRRAPIIEVTYERTAGESLPIPSSPPLSFGLHLCPRPAVSKSEIHKTPLSFLTFLRFSPDAPTIAVSSTGANNQGRLITESTEIFANSTFEDTLLATGVSAPRPAGRRFHIRNSSNSTPSIPPFMRLSAPQLNARRSVEPYQ